MTLSEIIKAAITDAGGNGLCNVGIDCGCGLNDIMPCGDPNLKECRIAKSRVLGPDEYVYESEPGDTIYEPI